MRYAQKRRFSLLEQRRIESEISLQTYLRSLIQTDKERRMQMRIEKYLEDKESNRTKRNETSSQCPSASSSAAPPTAATQTSSSSTTSHSLSILKQYLSKMMGYHNQQTTTSLVSSVSISPKLSSTSHQDMNIVVDHQLEQILRDVEQSSDQSLNELNHLFNEVDARRKRREIPEYLTCKLCYDLMKDPVITPCKLLLITINRYETKNDNKTILFI